MGAGYEKEVWCSSSRVVRFQSRAGAAGRAPGCRAQAHPVSAGDALRLPRFGSLSGHGNTSSNPRGRVKALIIPNRSNDNGGAGWELPAS